MLQFACKVDATGGHTGKWSKQECEVSQKKKKATCFRWYVVAQIKNKTQFCKTLLYNLSKQWLMIL